MTISPSHQPFWQDEPDQPYPQQTWKRIYPLMRVYGAIVTICILSIPTYMVYLLSPILAWIWVAFFAFLIGLSYYHSRQRKNNIQNFLQTQQRAQDATGASMIGSAVHVAGIPELEREQNIVLALIAPNLVVYPYQSDQPLAVIPLQQIACVQTVVYDDDRIPHTDVIDSSAQAIQLIIKYGNQDVACLFRRMKKVRPIDWYHAIQRARIEEIKKVG